MGSEEKAERTVRFDRRRRATICCPLNKKEEREIEKMEMEVGKIMRLNTVLKKIIDDEKMKINAVIKFKLLSIMKSLESTVSNFETIRNEKIREYGKEDENGNIRIDAKDKKAMELFNKSLEEVLNNKITVNCDKIPAKDIFNKGLPAEYLVTLYDVIQE